MNVETLSGGPYNDQAIHAIDLSRFFAGPVTEVQAAFQTPERAATILTFESGVVATLVFSCQAQAKTIGLQIFTREGTIRFEGWNFGLAHNSVDGTLPEDGDEDIFLTETEAFLHAVQSGDTTGLYSNAQDALATQLVIDAARQSHASGQRVKVPQFLPQQEDLLYVAG
ncbi:MAG: hypothetical protein JO061_12630 [Acidobacteriaceae bacterium]|nr:hypothetical protein [Acidobacteriaceae bacterium]